ncbi:hypothetical protein SF83666_c16180 [Sinorhizobium fredii CCBAU 83666]|nr:hypothetical protein SF83666_c16180 [Sinorhizobium fredii CCBAU 83666]
MEISRYGLRRVKIDQGKAVSELILELDRYAPQTNEKTTYR